MEHFVQDQCAQMNNDLVIANIFLKGVNSNIESNFRKMRYSKLEEIRKEINADFILTAHHADDQVETILMKIMNSSGLDGLQGLRKLRQNIIRPMYNISKSEISDYASLNNVKYIDDPTNSDNTFTRNFLRMNVLPELKKIIEALLTSVKRVFYVGLLLFIILYIYATIGSILFSTDIPERWNDVGVAMITLFQVLTLSSWEQVMLPLQDIYWWAWIYFFSFIIICGITMLNLLIAILVDVVINQKKL